MPACLHGSSMIYHGIESCTSKHITQLGFEFSTIDTVFLIRVKEGDFNEGKVADLKKTKRCTGSGSADEAKPMGQKEYSMKMLIRAVW